jgi:cell shape-determining protein MreC
MGKWRSWLILLVVSGLLWLVDGRGYFNWLKRPVASLTQPILRRVYQAKLEPVKDEGTQGWQVQQALLEAEIVELKEENQELRKLLGAPLPANWQFVPARVLGFEPGLMKIDVGQDMKVVKDDEVIILAETDVKGGILLGRVSQAGPRQAQVQLLSYPETRVNVKTSSGVAGVVRPANKNEDLILDEVLVKEELNSDELVLTRGGDGWLPGLVIGRVGEVKKIETAVYQQAQLQLLANPRTISRVWVVKR